MVRARGKTSKRVHHEREWYGDFLDFMASEVAAPRYYAGMRGQSLGHPRLSAASR